MHSECKGDQTVCKISSGSEKDFPDSNGGVCNHGCHRICGVSSLLCHDGQSDKYNGSSGSGCDGLFCVVDQIKGCGCPGDAQYAGWNQVAWSGEKASFDVARFKMKQISRYYRHKEVFLMKRYGICFLLFAVLAVVCFGAGFAMSAVSERQGNAISNTTYFTEDIVSK